MAFSKTGFFVDIVFTYQWIVRNSIGKKIKTILDVGCGDGLFMQAIARGQHWEIAGVNLHRGTTKKTKALGIYKNVLVGDICDLPKSVTKKKYDVVVALQVIEHLKKKAGQGALTEWEKLANKKIVISTPVGYVPYDRLEDVDENNPHQKHQSGWDVNEFRKRGYQVRGQGLKIIYGENGLAQKTSRKLLPFWQFLAFLFSPIVYCFPELGITMICVKNIRC